MPSTHLEGVFVCLGRHSDGRGVPHLAARLHALEQGVARCKALHVATLMCNQDGLLKPTPVCVTATQHRMRSAICIHASNVKCRVCNRLDTGLAGALDPCWPMKVCQDLNNEGQSEVPGSGFINH
jgi:hypothetical protein